MKEQKQSTSTAIETCAAQPRISKPPDQLQPQTILHKQTHTSLRNWLWWLPSEPDSVITMPHTTKRHHLTALNSKQQGCHVDGAIIPRCFHTVRHTLNARRQRQMRQSSSTTSQMCAAACLMLSEVTVWDGKPDYCMITTHCWNMAHRETALNTST